MAFSPPAAAGPLLHLDLREAHRQVVHAALHVQPLQRQLRLSLPRWTPGSYLIREYVRHLEALVLDQNGQHLPLRRTGVSSWEALLPSLEPLVLRYRLQAAELTVRTAHVDGDHAFLPLAAVALLVEGERWRPHRLQLSLPAGWQAFLPLERDPADGGDGPWWAADFDALVDSPVEAGPHPCHPFAVAGVPHRWVGWGDDLPSLDPQWLADVEQVCLACCRLLDEPRPAADTYLFVLHLREQGFGGLEHDAASVLLYGRRALAQPDGRRRLLQLVAHEYLHQWNGRRLRPAELTPIDYGSEAIVPTLWFVEGLTSYYDQLLPQAAGVSSEADLLHDLGEDLSRYRLTPGRRVQSLAESSAEAWVKLYRQDAGSFNSQVSYYLKGAVLALVLDLRLREGGSALQLVLRRLWRSHGRCRRGYQREDLLAALAAEDPALAAQLPRWLDERDDPDLDGALATVGLRLQPETAGQWWLGCQVELDAAGGGLLLRRLDREGPAAAAGLLAGDELLAIGVDRVRRPEDLERLLRVPEATAAEAAEAKAPTLEVLCCRDGRLRRQLVQVQAPCINRWRLEADPQAGPEQVAARQRWRTLGH